MRTDFVKKYEIEGVTVQICVDEDAQNPEETTDIPVYLVHFHDQFHRCPKELNGLFTGEESFREWLATAREDQVGINEEWAVFPVSAYIHGGIVLAMGDSSRARSFPDQQWDVSRCGWVFVKKDPKYWGDPPMQNTGDVCLRCHCGTVELSGDPEKPMSCTVTCRGKCGSVHLRAEREWDWRGIAEAHVQVWNQYLGGEVYGFVVAEGDDEEESCWGFYGMDVVIAEADAVAGAVAASRAKRAAEFSAFCATLDQEELDELVHGAKSEEASRINNDGPEDQVRFLLESGFTREQLIARASGA